MLYNRPLPKQRCAHRRTRSAVSVAQPMRTRHGESAPTLRARASRAWSAQHLQHIASKGAQCGSRITRALCVVAARITGHVHEPPYARPKGWMQRPRATHSKRNTGKDNNHDSVLTHANKLNINAMRTDGTCNTALPTTHTITRTRPVAMACPCRVSLSSAFPLSHSRALTAQ